jgi:hypothetical protein
MVFSTLRQKAQEYKTPFVAYEILIPMKGRVSIRRRPTKTAKTVTPLQEREIVSRTE